MSDLEETCASLRAQIAATETQLAGLKRELARAQEAAAAKSNNAKVSDSNEHAQPTPESRWPLLPEEYKRYGRQMIVSQVGLEGESCPSGNGLLQQRGSWTANGLSRSTEAARG
jgi:adenylyltransferase/sulfurtransferase